MTIRFLDLVESDRPDYPYMPGQVLDLPYVSKWVQAALCDGRAELVRGEEPELATVSVGERASVNVKQRRTKGVR